MTERMRSFRNGWTASWNTISDRENGTGTDCGEERKEKGSLSANGMGILICGLNGCGKSTLGRALADRLGYEFIDNEDLYFPKTDENYAFSAPRSREEAIRILETRIDRNSRFVFAAVKGDYGDRLIASLDHIVLVEVPKKIRSRRVRERSFRKFGERILPGGDLHDREEAWFALTDSRPEDYTEKWLETVRCPVIRVDGTLPVEENAEYLSNQLKL